MRIRAADPGARLLPGPEDSRQTHAADLTGSLQTSQGRTRSGHRGSQFLETDAACSMTCIGSVQSLPCPAFPFGC